MLFFDEPLSGLDPAAIRLLKRTMVECAERGATVLVSSHLLALVEDICRHLIVLRHGRCLFSGTVELVRVLCRVGIVGGCLLSSYGRGRRWVSR